MRETVFTGADLGTSMLRKSTDLAYLVERNGNPLIENPQLSVLLTLVHLVLNTTKSNYAVYCRKLHNIPHFFQAKPIRTS